MGEKAKILEFPKEKIVREFIVDENKKKERERAILINGQIQKIDLFTKSLAEKLLESLKANKFDIKESDYEDFIYDFDFTMEAVRSTLLRSIGQEHDIQQIVDEYYTTTEVMFVQDDETIE